MKNKERTWKCGVCGYVHIGNSPPEKCPQCSSSGNEYYEEIRKPELEYSGEKIDILLINGSTHSAHNSSIITELFETELKDRKLSYRKINLNEVNINHCWCCYSMNDGACTYPCRNQLDEAQVLHKMLLNSKAVIIVSPINWNNMSARLKDFLDRLTCIQNVTLLGKKSLTAGKILGIFVDGHEDGAIKTSMDIFFYFQQMGFILAPYSIAYRTHGAIYNAGKDNDFFRKDEKVRKDVRGLVNNLHEMIKLSLENKLKDKVKAVSE